MPFVPFSSFPLPWYFGVSTLLGPGSVIEPGNWGRVLNLTRFSHPDQDARWRLEQVFEHSRLDLVPSAPSRLDCLFVCSNREHARNFFAVNKRSLDVLYEVEPVSKMNEIFIADWTLWSPKSQNGIGFFSNDDALSKSRRYWTETAAENLEILLASPLRIIRTAP